MRSESSRVKIIFLKQLAFPVVDTLLVEEAIEGNTTFPTLPSSSSSLTSPLSDSLWTNFFPYTQPIVIQYVRLVEVVVVMLVMIGNEG